MMLYGATVKEKVHRYLMSDPIVRLPLRIRASLKAKLSDMAEKDHRSLNKQIEFLLDWCIREGVETRRDDLQAQPQRTTKRK